MCTPPPFGAGGGHTRRVERGGGGLYFVRSQTQLCTYVSTLWLQVWICWISSSSRTDPAPQPATAAGSATQPLSKKSCDSVPLTVCCCCIAGMNLLNIVKFPNGPCTTAGNSSRVCYTASECKKPEVENLVSDSLWQSAVVVLQVWICWISSSSRTDPAPQPATAAVSITQPQIAKKPVKILCQTPFNRVLLLCCRYESAEYCQVSERTLHHCRQQQWRMLHSFRMQKTWSRKSRVRLPWTVCCCCIAGMNLLNIVKFPNGPCTTAGNSSGVCYTASECKKPEVKNLVSDSL